MRLAISLATRRHPDLLKSTIDTTLKNIRNPNTTIFVVVDNDDMPTVEMVEKGEGHSPNVVTFSIAPREDSLGGKYNRILGTEKDADIYLAMVDYAPHLTPGFDEKIIEAASFWPDGIGLVVNHMANLSFTQIYAPTAGLVWKMGYIFPPFFPYWWMDHWLDDIARMIDRLAVADVWADCDSKRPGTMDRRDPVFWATFYDAAKYDRRRIARHIIKGADFVEMEWKKNLLLHNYHLLIEERGTKVNDHVRSMAAGWAQAVPPEAIDDRYIRLRSQALGMLRAYVAEAEAEELTLKMNGKQAAA
jgi:hypothetical protein